MTDTTTIQVRRDQAEQLKEIRGDSGNYKTAIDALLDTYEEHNRDRSVTLEPSEIDKIAHEVARRVKQ